MEMQHPQKTPFVPICVCSVCHAQKTLYSGASTARGCHRFFTCGSPFFHEKIFVIDGNGVYR